MIRALAIVACLAPAAYAQPSDDNHMGGGANAQMMMQQQDAKKPTELQHSHMSHGQAASGPAPTQSGQDAFAAIQEIVGILEADPKTDWSKVNIDALRQHLADMNAVTLAAAVKNEPIDGGMIFIVTGTGVVRDSVRRMVLAHAMTMNGVDGWRFEASEIEGGASLIVRPPAREAIKLRGLGFLGVMTRGMHHQEHHLMLARGEDPHH